MDTSNINYSLVHTGSIIGYRLPPSQLPSNPNKIWNGRVIKMYDGSLLLVELLEIGYYGLQEYVRVDQIVAVSEGD